MADVRIAPTPKEITREALPAGSTSPPTCAARAESQRRLLGLGLVSLLCILLVLHVDFGSLRMIALVALTIPFALIGGVANVFLTAGVLSLGSLVGFVRYSGLRPGTASC